MKNKVYAAPANWAKVDSLLKEWGIKWDEEMAKARALSEKQPKKTNLMKRVKEIKSQVKRNRRRDADAHLIVAAPDLLRAVEDLLEDHKRIFAEAHPHSTIEWEECVEVQQALAAINKATKRNRSQREHVLRSTTIRTNDGTNPCQPANAWMKIIDRIANRCTNTTTK
jgi:hypothetical protein